MEEWDEKEKNTVPIKKYKIKPDQLFNLISDATAFRCLLNIHSDAPIMKYFETLQSACDETFRLFNYPQNEEDRQQIRIHIKKIMQSKACYH